MRKSRRELKKHNKRLRYATRMLGYSAVTMTVRSCDLQAGDRLIRSARTSILCLWDDPAVVLKVRYTHSDGGICIDYVTPDHIVMSYFGPNEQFTIYRPQITVPQ